MELRERVAKSIHESNRIVPWEQTSQQDLAFERADAAIAAVLDALKEPTQLMVEAGGDVHTYDIELERAVPFGQYAAASIWPAMLAAFRTEALGEG